MPTNQPLTGAGRGVALPTSSGEVTGTGPGEYLGFTAAETGGTAAVNVTLYDNASAASGVILDVIRLAAGQSSGDYYPRPGREVVNGIYASVSGTGTLAGSVWQ